VFEHLLGYPRLDCTRVPSPIKNIRKEHGTMEKVKDLVCGMMIDPKTAAATSEYKGKTYYFCAKGCKVAFDKDPEKYIKGEVEAEHKH
jgi:YHS domain-containing protein